LGERRELNRSSKGLRGLKAKEAVLAAVKVPFDLEPEALDGLDVLLSDEEVRRMMSRLYPSR
jgi:hypothetical protein